jgi:hypothetical protein
LSVGLVGDGEPCGVGDVLAERQFSVDRIAGQRRETRVLRNEEPRLGLESIEILPREPTRRAQQLSIAVVLAPLVIESVADFVDDASHGAVVHRIVRL